MSIWGVATPVPIPFGFVPGANVTCTAGVETILATAGSASTIGTPGVSYILWASGAIAFAMGATASSSLIVAARIHGGADLQTWTVPPGMLIASTTFMFPFALPILNARAVAGTPLGGSYVEITALAGTTACTALAASTLCIAFLIQAGET